MTAHSKIGASSMYRWSVCPGSVRQSAGIESKSSAYAEEGSDAHALAARCLTSSLNATDFAGSRVTEDKRTFTVDAEMAEAVQVYVDAVNDACTPGCILAVEQQFDLSSVHPGCFGTGDAVIWNPKTRLLTVMDYKHGAGIPVDVRGNPQLRYYGLGALLQSGYPADRVRLVIVQPRCDHADGPVRAEEIDAIDLLDFCADLKRFAVATEAPDAPLVPGDHCRFCPAAKANACPELKNRAQAVAKSVFTPMQSYDPAELKRALDSRDIVKAWLKNLDEFAYAEAAAGRGESFGYKLVDKQGRRKWRDGAEEEIATLAEDDWFEPRTLKSPAQLEKVSAAAKSIVAASTVKESSGQVLVPLDDKRPGVSRVTAQHVFTALPTP